MWPPRSNLKSTWLCAQRTACRSFSDSTSSSGVNPMRGIAHESGANKQQNGTRKQGEMKLSIRVVDSPSIGYQGTAGSFEIPVCRQSHTTLARCSNELHGVIWGSVLLIVVLSMSWWWPRLEQKIRELC